MPRPDGTWKVQGYSNSDIVEIKINRPRYSFGYEFKYDEAIRFAQEIIEEAMAVRDIQEKTAENGDTDE